MSKKMPVTISDSSLRKAAEEGIDAYLLVFRKAYETITGGIPNATTMPLLNGWQHSLLAYFYFRDEVLEGGFVQLIQNGYGSYIFDNPFAKALRLFGLTDLSKLVYKAKEVYDANRQELEKETNEEDFTAMYEQYEAFDELEESFFEIEEDCTNKIARYIDEHLSDFADTIAEA